MFTKTKINKGTVALVFKEGEYVRFLTAGKHRLGWGETTVIYDLTKVFMPQHDLSLYLQDEALREILEVVEITDHEIVLRFENAVFKGILGAGRHAYWKGLVDYKFIRVDLGEREVTQDIHLNVLQRYELKPYLTTIQVESFEKALLFEGERYLRTLDSGVHYFWKTAKNLTVRKADLRQLQLEVNGQEILTKDKAGLRANFVLQYRIVDMEKALIEVKDYAKQLYLLTQLALREYMSAYSLDEILNKKDEGSDFVRKTLKTKAKDLGLEVLGGGLKDLILPGEVREIMNKVLIAQKQAQANTITRREETASTRSLLNTAKLLEENEMLFRLKEMEYVEKIADKITGITVSGDGKVLDRLRDIFTTGK